MLAGGEGQNSYSEDSLLCCGPSSFPAHKEHTTSYFLKIKLWRLFYNNLYVFLYICLLLGWVIQILSSNFRLLILWFFTRLFIQYMGKFYSKLFGGLAFRSLVGVKKLGLFTEND